MDVFVWPFENYFFSLKLQFILNVVWSNLREVKWGFCLGFNDTNILTLVRTYLCGTLIIIRQRPQPGYRDQTRIIINTVPSRVAPLCNDIGQRGDTSLFFNQNKSAKDKGNGSTVTLIVPTYICNHNIGLAM